jgi:hypothetical protein
MSKTSRSRKYEYEHLLRLRTHDASRTIVELVYRAPTGEGKHYNPNKNKMRGLMRYLTKRAEREIL